MNDFPLPLSGDITALYPVVTGVHVTGTGDVSLPINGKVTAGTSKNLGKFVVITSDALGVAFRLYNLDKVYAEDGKWCKPKEVLGSCDGQLKYDIVRLHELKKNRLSVHADLEFSPRLFVNPASMHLELIGLEV